MTIDDKTLEAKNLISHYFQLNKYIDDDSIEAWMSIDYQEDFGFTDITPAGLSEWKKMIEDKKQETIDYLVKKAGYTLEDSKIPLENIYQDDLDIISDKKMKTDKFICQVHKSLSRNEMKDCFQKSKNKIE